MSPFAVAVAAAGSLGFIWLGYPAIVGLLVRLLGPRPVERRSADAPLPSVSVLLASREDTEVIRARITNLIAGDFPPSRLEVVVALDIAAPCLPEGLQGVAPRLRCVLAPAPGGKAVALNAAAAAASGDVLVFVDSFQRFAPDTIRRLTEPLEDPTVGAVSGSLERGERGNRWHAITLYWRLERWLRECEAALHSAIGVTGAIYAMRARDWRPLPPGLILDDLFVPMRLILGRRRIMFDARASAEDVRSIAPLAEFHRKVRTLTGNWQLCAWLPGVLVPWRNPVWAAFLCHKVLRLLTPFLGAVLLASLVVGLAARIGPASTALGVAAAAAAVVGLGSRFNPYTAVSGAVQSLILLPAAAGFALWRALRRDWTWAGQ
jgi:biofilm PGA synthesis N-glycosyltransferase PgaC